MSELSEVGKSLIEPFERHFGPRATKVLLLVLALGVAAFAFKSLLDNFLIPAFGILEGLFHLLSGIKSNVSPVHLEEISNDLTIAFTASITAFYWYDRRQRYRAGNQAVELAERAISVLNETAKQRDELVELSGTAIDQAGISLGMSNYYHELTKYFLAVIEENNLVHLLSSDRFPEMPADLKDQLGKFRSEDDD